MKAIFIRALESSGYKQGTIRETIISPNQSIGTTIFEIEPESFRQLPRSPFAYWVSERLRRIFISFEQLEGEKRVARITNPAGNDTRYFRLFWEIPISHTSRDDFTRRWIPLAKGGKYSPFYADVHLVVDWDPQIKSYRGFLGTKHRPLVKLASSAYFFRPGLTWPSRTQRFGPRVLPAGCIFTGKGPAIVTNNNDPVDILSVLSVICSSVFRELISVSLNAADSTARSYEVGPIQQAPYPELDEKSQNILVATAKRSWSFKRSIDTIVETSHAFNLPGLLQANGVTLANRTTYWSNTVSRIEGELATIQSEIDDICFDLYGIDGEDRAQIERGLGGDVSDSTDDKGEAKELDAMPLVTSLLSWCVGVAFGGFDLRLETGERNAPPEPDPFDPLPVCSPGMLTGEDGLPLDDPPIGYAIDFPRDGILVDDQGAERDFVARSRQVFEHIFDDPSARWEEAAKILGDRDQILRSWFARQFFGLHIKQYSISRRKAPIYWQLATPSASYSTWLYYHRFTQDTLFRLLNDHIGPKLQHEERKLTNHIQEVGPNPTASQVKEIDTQETFVGELRGFRDEVTRVAPLWNPNLNDGVILNFAPLWRLVPQHKAWQHECKSAWDKLCKGDYDWAHLAMYLWPERVVPKCVEDRSLAIAHELEEFFWYEDDDSKWQQKMVSQEEVENLIADRTSPAVKDALKTLHESPVLTSSGPQRKRKPRTAKRAAPSKPAKQSVKTMNMFDEGEAS